LGKPAEQIFREECRRNFSFARLSKHVNPYFSIRCAGVYS
jgi:hypothetical protein